MTTIPKSLAGLALAAGLTALPAAAQAPGPQHFHLSLGYDGRLLVKVLDMQVDETAEGAGFSSTVRLRSPEDRNFALLGAWNLGVGAFAQDSRPVPVRPGGFEVGSHEVAT